MRPVFACIPVLAAAFLGVVSLTGTASAADQPLRLEELIESARTQNPSIRAARADWLAEKKRVWIDSALPDPMAGYDLMGSMTETRVGPQKNRFMVSQEVPFPVKLIQRGKMAAREAEAAWFRLAAVEREVVNDLTKLYYELYWADASLETLEEVKGLLKNFEGVAQAQYSNLKGTQRDVAKAQAEVSMSLEKIFLLRREREVIAAKINALLDRDPMLAVGRAARPAKPVLERPVEELINLAVKNRPEIKELEALARKSRHGAALAKLAYIPDINVGFEYTRVGAGTTELPADMDGKDSWMFPLRINLPLWQNRIVPEILEARDRRTAADARTVEMRNTVFFQVKDAYHRYKNAMEIVTLYESAIIPQAKLALSADQAGYEGGKTDFLNLLDSERVYLNALLTEIEIFTEALKSHADLVRATGLDLQTMEPEKKEKAEHEG
ncbi:MAG: TolC family protein [Candidatus Omnitrophica bacterium]|nr:TolC family protein [Candidatus Omnitrophota bacterium]